jgi:ascorbate-specific PTS system EIIC-type component UlaA
MATSITGSHFFVVLLKCVTSLIFLLLTGNRYAQESALYRLSTVFLILLGPQEVLGYLSSAIFCSTI